MRTRNLVRSLLASLALLLMALPPASAEQIRYSWTGIVRPEAGQPDPWALGVNGLPFELQVLVDDDAEDLDGSVHPDHALFQPEALLWIDSDPAVVVSSELQFHDDVLLADGQVDWMIFYAKVERLGATLSFGAAVQLPPASFELASPAAPDLPPLFPTTHPINLVGVGTNNLVMMPHDAPVTAVRVPEPGVTATALGAGAALFAVRVRARRRGGAGALPSSSSGSARSARTPS